MINLFIDTNIFLSFYHLTTEDLEELKKLAVLIDNNEIQLFLPDQVKNEFARNRGAKIIDAMRKLQDAKFNLSFPLFAKDYQEYANLRDLMKKADGLHAQLMKNIMSDAEMEALSADKVVSALFSKAKNIVVSEKLYLKAVMRIRLGNPPGKEGSMGDAVNWECLLSEVSDQEDIYIVSGDRDFRSQLSEGEINEYLDDEWSEKKKSALYFYSKISDFFKENFPNIKIASEVERDLLIQKLAESGSFATTHVLIAKLLAQPEFSPAQVEQLVEIPGLNNQVGWIVGDPDVHSFYKGLLQKYGDKIQEDATKKLAEIVAEGEPASSDGIPDF
jgi:predicted nucleic acid-binding protein